GCVSTRMATRWPWPTPASEYTLRAASASFRVSPKVTSVHVPAARSTVARNALSGVDRAALSKTSDTVSTSLSSCALYGHARSSVRARHAEVLHRHEVQDHLLRDRRDAEQARVTPQALDIGVARVAQPAHHLHCPIDREL